MIEFDDGSHYTFIEMYKLSDEQGLLNTGYFKEDMGYMEPNKGIIGGKYDPTDMKNFFAYRVGGKVGSTIENMDRLIHFISMMKRGSSAKEAARSVNHFLFDYGDLTAFEQNVLKRIFPYYTWLRKNGELQIEQLIDKPGKYQQIAKISHGIEGMNDEDDRIDKNLANDFARDWLQLPFSVKNPEGRMERVLLNPSMPYMDISKVTLNPEQAFRNAMASTNMLIKTPIEQLLNKNFYYDEPIVESKDSQFVDRSSNLLSNFPAFGNAKDVASKSGLDLGLQVLNLATGVKMLSYDYDKYKSMKIKELLNTKPSLGDKFNKLVSGYANDFSRAVSDRATIIGRGIVEGMDTRPLKPWEYEGALRPISQAKYNSLSDEEKQLYNPPAKNDVIAYNKQALELSKQAYENGNGIKKYVWAMFDKFNVGARSRNDMTVGFVTKIIDGDTFNVKIGDEIHSVRMLLIDTPESAGDYTQSPQPYGKEASNYTKKALIDKDVTIYFDRSRREKYGRMLGYVEVDGRDIGKELIEQGLAKMSYLYESP